VIFHHNSQNLIGKALNDSGTAPKAVTARQNRLIWLLTGFAGQLLQHPVLKPSEPCNPTHEWKTAERYSMTERWLSVEEIATHLGVNPDTIYKWISRKGMPSHKVGKLWKFLASEIDEWVKSGHAAQDV
jgi:excisionase family DNA binding protein